MAWDGVAGDVKGFRWQSLSPSAQVLLAGNALTVIVAIIFGLDPAEIIWVYWLESIVIGMFTVLAFITMGLGHKPGPKVGSPAAAYGFAIFFCIHYGMFHGAYALFLSIMPWFIIENPDILGMGITIGILALSHGYSFVKNVLGNPAGLAITKENLQRTMMAPYSRIIPMHLTIIFSGFLMIPLQLLETIAEAVFSGAGIAAADRLMKFVALLLFMGLKTGGDLYGHLNRYR
ncbi:DUF6498-containing protein [Candidatus Micrarchaeota archaeon]|nr:DUF6498-containing protein [Candidatus Micrarchaeota archaeon]